MTWVDQTFMIISSILSIFPKLLYLLCDAFLSVVDMFQYLFRKFAGLEVYYVEDASGAMVPQEGDIVYDFLSNIIFGDKYPLLSNVFWSLIILAVILLFVSTIVAIIRKEYTYAKESSNGPIIGSAFKSLAYVAMVPIIVLFGVYLSNVLLRAVDYATSPQTSTSMTVLDTKYLEGHDLPIEGKRSYVSYDIFGIQVPTSTTPFSSYIFEVCGYGANRVRLEDGKTVAGVDGVERAGFLGLLQNGEASNFGGMFTGDNAEVVAAMIDEAFMATVTVKEEYAEKELNMSSVYQEKLNYGIDIFEVGNMLMGDKYTTFNKSNVSLVWYYYDLWSYNYFIALAAGIIMIGIMFNIAFGMLKRIIEMIALFMVYAPILGFAPLDNQKAFNSWRQKFMSATLMAFGAIVGINIVMVILPYLQYITFFEHEILNNIVAVLLILVALSSVKSLIGVVSGFVGGANAEDEGGKMAKEIGSTVGKAAQATLAIGGAAATTAFAGAKIAAAGIKGAAGKAIAHGSSGRRAGLAADTNAERAAETQKLKEDKLADMENEELDNMVMNSSYMSSQGKAFNTLTAAEWADEKKYNYQNILNTRNKMMKSQAHQGDVMTAKRNAEMRAETAARADLSAKYGRRDYDATTEADFKIGLRDVARAGLANADIGGSVKNVAGTYKTAAKHTIGLTLKTEFAKAFEEASGGRAGLLKATGYEGFKMGKGGKTHLNLKESGEVIEIENKVRKLVDDELAKQIASGRAAKKRDSGVYKL